MVLYILFASLCGESLLSGRLGFSLFCIQSVSEFCIAMCFHDDYDLFTFLKKILIYKKMLDREELEKEVFRLLHHSSMATLAGASPKPARSTGSPL